MHSAYMTNMEIQQRAITININNRRSAAKRAERLVPTAAAMVRGFHFVVNGLDVRHLNRIRMGNVNGDVLLHRIWNVLFDRIRNVFLDGIRNDLFDGNCDFLDDGNGYGLGDGNVDRVGMGNGNENGMGDLDVDGLRDGNMDLFVDRVGHLFGDLDVVVHNLGLNLTVVHLVVVRTSILVSAVVSTMAEAVVG